MNSLNDSMVNGNDLSIGSLAYWSNWELMGDEIPQNALVLPFPGDSNKYYIIHGAYYSSPLANGEYCDTLYYSIVDMQQDSGRGAVVSKNQHLWVGDLNTSDLIIFGGYTACKHANGRDWWLVTHKDSSNIFMTFLLTPTGFQGPFQQTIGPVLHTHIRQAAFSPDGTKYVLYSPEINKKVRLFSFDRCTGIFNNPKSITSLPDTTYGSVGIAFSPNSRYLYTSSFTEINQFDTWVSNVASTKILVALGDSFPCPTYWVSFYQMQLASNGKIYISSPNGSLCFSVINYPDSAGTACQAIPHGLDNLPFYNAFSVPNYPNYYLGTMTGSVCDSLTGIAGNTLQLKTFSINPNPNNGVFTLNYQLPENKTGTVEILNTLGKVVLKETLPPWSFSHKVEMKNAPAGIYLCRISTGTSASYVKFVVTPR
jgi:hypothetical protein